MERLFPRLREELTVRHLRTERRYLETVGPDARVSEALRACEAGDYDVLPVLQGDRLLGLFGRASAGAAARGARVRDVMRRDGVPQVPRDHPVLHVLPRLARGDAVLVLHGRRVDGIVTYADLNRRPFRVLLYAQLAEVEGRLGDLLRARHPDPEAFLHAHRDRMQAREVAAWRESEAQGRAIHPVEVMGLRSIMRAALAAPGAAHALGYADEADALRWLERLVRLRNRVMHVVRRLVADPRETRALHEEVQHLHALTRRSAREDGAPPLRKRPRG